MSNPLISIIVPCYNQGQFINETINSIINQTYPNFEIIIVNDGSTDIETNNILKNLSHPNVEVIHTKNQGLSEARNTAIRNSSGKYILPLDSDDKISETYLTSAVEVLENNPNVILVYGEAEYFGDIEGKWDLVPFDMNKMIFYNLIYPAGVYRRSDYDKTKGYDRGMVYGWEDWEFWLSLIELGGQVHFLKELCFIYRIRAGSMVRSMTDEHRKYLQQRVYCRHSQLYNEYFSDPLSLYGDFKYYKTELEKVRSNFVLRALISVFKKIGVLQ